MRIPLKSLGKLGSYAMSSAVAAGASFLIVPLILRVTSTAEYGRYSLLEPLVMLLSQLALLGANFGLIKLVGADDRPLSRVLSGLQGASLIVVVPVAVIAAVALRLGAPYSTLEAIGFGVLILSESALLLLFSAFRAGSQAAAFAWVTIVKAAAFLLLVGFFAAMAAASLETAGDIVGIRLAAGLLAVGIGLSALGTAGLRPTVDWPLFAEATRYGFPLLLAVILAMVIEFADRYVIGQYFSAQEVGEYVVLTKVAMVLKVAVVTPFGIWWPTVRFRQVRAGVAGQAYFRLVAVLLAALLLLAAGALWFLAPAAFAWYAPGVAYRASVVFLLLLSVVFVGIATVTNVGILNEGKTQWSVVATGISGALNLILCLVLIPKFSLIGAAWATALSYLAMWLLQTALSQRFYHIDHAWAKMGALFVVFGAGVWGARSVTSPLSDWAGVAAAVVFVGTFLPVAALVVRSEVVRYMRQQRKQDSVHAG